MMFALRRDFAWRQHKLSWQACFSVNGVNVVNGLPEKADGVLFVHSCSRVKNKHSTAVTPQRLYAGATQAKFFTFCSDHALPYGILSDQYGLCFEDEEFPFYDTPPCKLTDMDLCRLGVAIAVKSKARGFHTIAYWRATPSLAVPYLVMLKASGLNVYYSTRLITATKKA